MQEKIKELTTEKANRLSAKLDQLSTMDILKLMNDEDKKVAYAVEQQIENIEAAVDLVSKSLKAGGRLFYFGAGTSGRLGVLDAAECPPTFGTDPLMVQGIIAGGPTAFIHAVEGAEDDLELGVEDVRKHGVGAGDVVVGITASGRTPYVMGALEEARLKKAETISLSCNPVSDISLHASVNIHIVVGPEIVSGSTRLKAGTAQKLVLNMLTTAVMIRLGKVYGNLMVSVRATNKKLKERVKQMIMQATNVGYEEAERLAELADGDARIAIVMKKTGLNFTEAVKLLEKARWNVRDASEGNLR